MNAEQDVQVGSKRRAPRVSTGPGKKMAKVTVTAEVTFSEQKVEVLLQGRMEAMKLSMEREMEREMEEMELQLISKMKSLIDREVKLLVQAEVEAAMLECERNVMLAVEKKVKGLRLAMKRMIHTEIDALQEKIREALRSVVSVLGAAFQYD